MLPSNSWLWNERLSRTSEILVIGDGWPTVYYFAQFLVVRKMVCYTIRYVKLFIHFIIIVFYLYSTENLLYFHLEFFGYALCCPFILFVKHFPFVPSRPFLFAECIRLLTKVVLHFKDGRLWHHNACDFK